MSAIDIAPVADGNHKYKQPPVVYFVDDPETSSSRAPLTAPTGQFLGTGRPWRLGQQFNGCLNANPSGRI